MTELYRLGLPFYSVGLVNVLPSMHYTISSHCPVPAVSTTNFSHFIRALPRKPHHPPKLKSGRVDLLNVVLRYVLYTVSSHPPTPTV